MPDDGGVHVTGSNVNVNTGSGRATQNVRISGGQQTASALQQIDQLLAALMASARQLPADQAKVVEEEANWLYTEMRSGKFQCSHTRERLATLAKAAGQAVPVIELVNQLWELINGLQH